MKRLLLALVVVSASLVGVTAGAKPSAADPSGSSAVTASGSGDFESLKVTVAQTKNLIGQVARVSWTGGAPTQPASGDFNTNFLQIMQCWGDAPDGPRREQCQFGGLGAIDSSGRGAPGLARRQVTYGAHLIDPLETIKAPSAGGTAEVPFESVTGKTVTKDLLRNEFFDSSSTNEVTVARTRADGSGEMFFEMQTSREAPGLGCGEALRAADGSVAGRRCWLVVIPRGDKEVDGSVATGASGALISSPLSATNWSHRIVVPLDFQPIGAACTLGKAERPTVGQEIVSEAVLRWQPKLCETGAIYGFAQVNDAVARRQLLTNSPGMAFVSRPLGVDQPSTSGPVVYAPVAVSAVGIAFNVESQSLNGAPTEVKVHDGERLTHLDLTARLVAKLITQSYRYGASYFAKDVETNPTDVSHDPEFLALNPEFKKLAVGGIADVLLPIGLADATSQVWNWLKSDKEASAFLSGQPDPWGMRVNPNFRNLEIPREDFPKKETFCAVVDNGSGSPPLCTFDAHPYASDLHSAARAASRGDTLVRNWDPNATPPTFKKTPPQLSGTRQMLAFTDAATASRYSLPMARIRNAAGLFVAPSTASLLAGVAAMQPTSTPGVLAPNPTSQSPDAYPLTTLTYAATVPLALTPAARSDYAALLKYVAGDGQQTGLGIGQLPPGYAPLPTALRAQTAAKAAAILHPTALPVTPAVSGGTGQLTGGAGISTVPGTVGGKVSPSLQPLGPIPSVPTGVGTPTPVIAGPPAVAAVTTSGRAGIARFALIGALLIGCLAALAGPAMNLLAGSRQREKKHRSSVTRMGARLARLRRPSQA